MGVYPIKEATPGERRVQLSGQPAHLLGGGKHIPPEDFGDEVVSLSSSRQTETRSLRRKQIRGQSEMAARPNPETGSVRRWQTEERLDTRAKLFSAPHAACRQPRDEEQGPDKRARGRLPNDG